MREVLTPATATRPGEDKYYYDSDDSVLDIDQQFPELAERIGQWQAAQKSDASNEARVGHGARAGGVAREENVARAEGGVVAADGEVPVGRDPRAADVTKTSREVDMK